LDFDFSDEQRLLKDSVDRLLAEPTHGWREFAEMGLTGLPFSEADGGFGGGAVETMLVMEAIGRHLATEPYLATVILCGNLIRLAATPAQRAHWIPRIADGSATLAFAHSERQARYDLHDVATTAKATAAGTVIDGRKTAVLQADTAEALLVSARTAGQRRDTDGITLFLVDPRSPGVTIEGYPTQDGRRAAEIDFSAVMLDKAATIGPLHGAFPLITQVIDIAIAAISAEAVGAMDELLALTTEYLKTRKQFGVAIGSFQSLQHKAADMMMALEQARSMAIYAAMMADAPPAERRPALSAAKVQINRSARFVGQQAIQLHGGIGMTMEYKAGHLFKRLTMIESSFGDTDFHLRAVTEAGGLIHD
jgi:pimeloyl-CoA dehydrogenase small subunit